MKKILIGIISIFFLLFGYQLVVLLHNKADSVTDTQLTTLVQQIPINTSLVGKKLSIRNTIILPFTATYDHLGIVGIRFDKPREGSDTIVFRIKEAAADVWYYEHSYEAHTFDTSTYYTFGFPPIEQSKNHSYVVELLSLRGEGNGVISLYPSSQSFIVKYFYSKEYFRMHPVKIAPFLWAKIITYGQYVSLTDVTRMLVISLLPLFFYIFIPLLHVAVSRLEKSKTGPIIIFFATVIISGYLSLYGADIHHDGIVLKPALDVVSGAMLFRDTFTQYGALTTLLQAGALFLFGNYLFVIKLLTALFYGLISVLLYKLGRKILPELLVFMTLLIWIFTAPYFSMISIAWSSVYALFFQLFSSYCFVQWITKKKTRYLFITGVGSALTFWCRQPVGILLFFAVIGVLIYFRMQQKHFLQFLKGNVWGSLPFMIWIVYNHALKDWWLQSILLCFSFAQWQGNTYHLDTLFASLFPPSSSPVSIWVLLPISALVLCIKHLYSRQSKVIIALSFIGLASWLQYYPQNDPKHSYWGATPLYILFTYVIYGIIREYLLPQFNRNKLLVQGITVIILLFVFFPDISFHIGAGIEKMTRPYVTINAPSVLRYMRFSPDEAKEYTYINNTIQNYFSRSPKGNVITLGPDALYLAFDRRIHNYQPMYVNWLMVNSSIYPEFEAKKDAYIKMAKPLIISFFELMPEGYCRMDEKVYRGAFFIQPCEVNMSL